jgi:hypothetical protein
MERIRWQAHKARLTEQESGRGRAAVKAALDHRFSNAAAKLQAGVPVPLSERPSEEELATVYGPDEARRLTGEMDTYARVAPDIARLATATEAEAGAVISKYAPNPASDNFAFEQRAQETVVRAWQASVTQRNTDPAAFLAQHSPTVAANATALAQAQDAFAKADPADQPAAFAALQAKGEAFADFLLAEQARLGVPNANRALLPKAMADRIRDDFEGKLAQGDVAGAVTGIRQSVAIFGDAGVHVIPQLGQDAGPIARFALEGLDLRTIETFAAATRDGDKVLKDAVGAGWKDLEEGVRGQLAAFDATGSTEYPAYYDATLKIAAAKVRTGMAPEVAAAQAASETINGRYAFGGQAGRVDYRVPLADVQGRPINADAVMRGAETSLAQLKPGEFALGDRVPVGVDDAEFRRFRLGRIQRTGRWLNAGDESGLLLHYLDDSGRLVPVKSADGAPIRRTWGELAATRTAPASDANYRGIK